jgi:putative ABC transport system permease protein
VGVFVLGVDNPDNAAAISRAVDNVFKNSLAETLTETEQAFQLGFVAMSNQIIAAIRVVSYGDRDRHGRDGQCHGDERARAHHRIRHAEGARLRPGFLSMLVFGESLIISAFGGALGMLLTPPAAILQAGRGRRVPGVHGVARDHGDAGRVRAGGGLAAAIVPAVQAARVRIVEGLRAIG